jgi:hypothetical protein
VTVTVGILCHVDEEGSKMVMVGWLDKNNSYNDAVFHSSSLDKVDDETVKTKRKTTVSSAKKKNKQWL